MPISPHLNSILNTPIANWPSISHLSETLEGYYIHTIRHILIWYLEEGPEGFYDAIRSRVENFHHSLNRDILDDMKELETMLIMESSK